LKSDQVLSLHLRLLVLAWLLIYIPAYFMAYGGWHFLQLCNLGVLISCAGILSANSLLISSQAVATPVIGIFWLVDFLARLITGRFIHAGTAYMWDTSIPLLVRVLSLYHIVLPLLLIYCLRKAAYDKRGFAVQAGIAMLVMLASLFAFSESENLNYVYHWPGGRILFGQPYLHVLISFLLLILVYWPSHYLLKSIWMKRVLVQAK